MDDLSALEPDALDALVAAALDGLEGELSALVDAQRIDALTREYEAAINRVHAVFVKAARDLDDEIHNALWDALGDALFRQARALDVIKGRAMETSS